MEDLKPHRPAAYRRQEQIMHCLYENLLRQPYPSVSISDLCQQLGISRKTFYNYFPDKDTCFRAIINQKLQNCSLHISENTAGNSTLEETIAAFLSFWKEEKIFFDIVVRNNLLLLLMDQYIYFLREEDKEAMQLLSTPQMKTDQYVLASCVSVIITSILQWYLRGFETSLEEMVRIYQRLVYQPLISPEDTNP